MKSRLVISLGSAILLGLSWAQAEDIDAASRTAAERVAIGTCATCHGPQGHSYSPKFPVLAGQQASYLVSQLQGFKRRLAAMRMRSDICGGWPRRWTMH